MHAKPLYKYKLAIGIVYILVVYLICELLDYEFSNLTDIVWWILKAVFIQNI